MTEAPSRLPVIATLAVAAAAGVLAAVATRDVAVATGAVTDPRLAWLLPVIIEGGAVTAGLLAWRRTSVGVSATPERLALLTLVVLAVAVNASHAAGHSLLGVVLAACPPLVLIVSAELLLRNREAVALRAPKRARKPVSTRSERSLVSTERAPAVSAERRVSAGSERPVVSGERPVVSAERAPEVSASTEWASLTTEQKHARVAEVLASTPDVTGAQLALTLGCGASTARRLLAQVRQAA